MPTIQHTFGPYEALINKLESDSVSSWSTIEDDFLAATSLFDTEYSKGEQSSGWYQAKARPSLALPVFSIRKTSSG